MDLNTLRQQTFAATGAAPGENGTAIFGLHARTETKLTFTSAF